jgi:diguanylate cyclase (GGDEF)-like protein
VAPRAPSPLDRWRRSRAAVAVAPGSATGRADSAAEPEIVVESGALVRGLAATSLLFAAFNSLLAIGYQDAGTAWTAMSLVAYAAWLGLLSRLRAGRERRVAEGVVWGGVATIAGIAAVQPGETGILAVAIVLPAIIGVSFLERRRLDALLGAAWAIGVAATVASHVAARETRLPVPVMTAFETASTAAALAIAMGLLRRYGVRLRTAARDLSSLVAMSRELAQARDFGLAGDVVTRHVALGVGADECGLCYWDPARDRVRTYGYYPAERRALVADDYSLGDYPATRALLERGGQTCVRDDDPTADPAELAYLRSLGQRSMLILTLAANGTTLGTIELTSSDVSRFDARRIALASKFAAEAAIALDNARLHDLLRHQAFHDGLTGLANRALFRDRLAHALERGARAREKLAVLFLDIDDFKRVNDAVGHHGGDTLLIAIGERVRSCLRSSDTASRLGGDEFAVLLEGLTTEADAEQVAQRLVDELRVPFRAGEVSTMVAASIGIAFGVAGTDTADALLRNADFAMYRAKALGKGRYACFRPELRQRVARRTELQDLLAGAVARGELAVHYQPIVALADESILGLEALARWTPAGRDPVSPVEFIPIAEETGAIIPIGRWVLAEGCRQLRTWRQEPGLEALSLSVNLSARQFAHPDLGSDVLAALAENGLPGAALTLEITESVLMRSTPSTMRVLEQLRRVGIRIAIDDFGTGYSSLEYLERFPVDALKIDKTFVDAIGNRRLVLPRAIVQIGRALGLQVVAEGVERPDQLRSLRRLGCVYAQGHLFAPPLDGERAGAMLTAGIAAARLGPGRGLAGLRAVPNAPKRRRGRERPGDRAIV